MSAMRQIKLDSNQVLYEHKTMKKLHQLQFNPTFADLGRAFGAYVIADALPDACLVDVSPDAMKMLGIDYHAEDSNLLTAVTAGHQVLSGMCPFAALYSGHQFGHYVPQLGDGRAMLLGSMQYAGQHWEWQLKGAGVTPFSRRGDGRAVLRSSIREYLVSEAMAGLGIATTRAVALVGSPLHVYREQAETAACVLRVAQNFIRFGSFEVFYYRGQHDLLRTLANKVLQQDYPELLQQQAPYLALLRAVIVRTAALMADWQSVGFMHGVMNTDNMSILGLTLDYGPFSFMETYQPDFICNHSDHEGRYAFNRQPDVALWNCACLAQALLPLLDANTDKAVMMARDALDAYWPIYHDAYMQHMRAKLGLTQEQPEDAHLIRDWLQLLHREQADFTLAHRNLAQQVVCPYTQPESVIWWAQYQQRLAQEGLDAETRTQRMHAVNPKYVLRTWMAQEAIDLAQQGDFTVVQRLRALLAQPYADHFDLQRYAQPAPAWAQGLVLSCSS